MIRPERRQRRGVRGRQHTVGGARVRRLETPGGTSPAQSIGRFFRTARKSQNLSQEQLAELTRGRPGRVSRAMISAVERGLHLPGLEVLLTLSQALHVSPMEVLERLELSRSEPVETAGLSFDQIDDLAGKSFWAGDHRRAAAYYAAALRVLSGETSDDPEERRRRVATIEIRRGAALRRCGACTAARAAVERAISLTDEMPELQAQGYVVLAALLVQLGVLPLARDAADRAVALSEGGGLQVQGWAWIEKGEVLAATGQFVEARRAFLQARQRVRGAGDRNHEINVEGNIGWCLQGLGRYRQAHHRYVRAVELARKYKVRASEALWLVALGRLALLEDRLDQADAYGAAALEISRHKNNLLTCFRAEWLRHLVSRRQRPDDPDRHRVAYLKKLYARLEQHRGIDEIREFKQAYCSPSTRRGGCS